MKDNIHFLTALVNNCSGVLTRISGLFARRGYNIESLTVCGTENKDVSRMIIVVSGDEKIIEQIIRQLEKQIEVIKVEEVTTEESVIRELLLVKISVESAQRTEVMSVCNIFKAHIVDIDHESLVLELTGKPQKIDAFLSVISNAYNVIELARSGASALMRGDKGIYEDKTC